MADASGWEPWRFRHDLDREVLRRRGRHDAALSVPDPTYKLNGVSVSAGTASPTGSNIPSATTINPGEVLWFIDPYSLVALKPKAGSGWNMDFDENRIPNNISSSIRYLRYATNIFGDQPTHGLPLFGFKGVGQ